MVVGVRRLELLLYAPRSLKEKRGIVQRILGRCRSRFPVSCAETGDQDLWQRAELGFVMVGNDENRLRSVFDQIEAEIERSGSAEIIAADSDFFTY